MKRPATERINGRKFVDLDELIEMFSESLEEARNRGDSIEVDRLRSVIADLASLR